MEVHFPVGTLNLVSALGNRLVLFDFHHWKIFSGISILGAALFLGQVNQVNNLLQHPRHSPR